jgi:hypothetical protein
LEVLDQLRRIGKILDWFPCTLLRTEVLPFDQPLVSFTTSVIPLRSNLFSLLFFVFIAGVVGDEIRYGCRLGTIKQIGFVGLQVCDRDDRVDFPSTRNLEFVGKSTNCSEDCKRSRSLGGKFV